MIESKCYPLEKIERYMHKIRSTEDSIAIVSARSTAPKNQVLSKTPKSKGGQRNELEEYVIRKDALSQLLKRQKQTLYILWVDFLNHYAYGWGLSAVQIRLVKYRYYYGLRWKDVRKKLIKDYPHINWTDNKMFRLHKTAIKRINNYEKNTQRTCKKVTNVLK